MPVLCLLACDYVVMLVGSLLVDRLHELPYHQRYTLDALDLLLRPH